MHNNQIYMVTTATWTRRTHFRDERWARLLIDTLYHYRGSAYLVYEFVIMPDHIHVLLTPLTSLEKAVQFIKGGFSFRAKKELGSNVEVWQKGFQDHRIRDAGDYLYHVRYIHENPAKARLCQRPEAYPYSSLFPTFEKDPVPEGLKPQSFGATNGAAEAAPLQSQMRSGSVKLFLTVLVLCCSISIPSLACWQTAPPVLQIQVVSLNGRATADGKPETGIRFELHHAITFNRVEGWKTGLWESKIIKSATSDSEGLFTFGDTPPGRYWLLVVRGSMDFPVEVVNSYRKPPYKRLWYNYFADGCEELRVEDTRAVFTPSTTEPTGHWPLTTE